MISPEKNHVIVFIQKTFILISDYSFCTLFTRFYSFLLSDRYIIFLLFLRFFHVIDYMNNVAHTCLSRQLWFFTKNTMLILCTFPVCFFLFLTLELKNQAANDTLFHVTDYIRRWKNYGNDPRCRKRSRCVNSYGITHPSQQLQRSS